MLLTFTADQLGVPVAVCEAGQSVTDYIWHLKTRFATELALLAHLVSVILQTFVRGHQGTHSRHQRRASLSCEGTSTLPYDDVVIQIFNNYSPTPRYIRTRMLVNMSEISTSVHT